VSPILTRPIREQLEHDRIIRQLQARYKRKHEVVINPGAEQNQSVMVGELAVYPDLLLYSTERSRRLEGTVEVETGESVNQLEALAEWGVYSKLKAPFYLYVPPQSVDSARRICDEQQFPVAEIWVYHSSLDQVRFTQVYRSPAAAKAAAAAAARAANEKPPVDQVTRTSRRKTVEPAPAANAGKAANGKNDKAANAKNDKAAHARNDKVANAKNGKTAAKDKVVKPAKSGARTTAKSAKAVKPAVAAKSSPARAASKSAKPAKAAKTAAKRPPAVKKRR
jgi:hypothetical protein